jgi:hypothetical protein
MKHALAFLIAIGLCWASYGQTAGGGGGDAIGSLPHTLWTEPGPCSGSSKVKAGASAENLDGVSVSNDAASKGEASLSPGDGAGTPDCASNVVTKNGFEGTIDGLDVNDTVSVGANNTTTVTGKGGYVALGGHSTTTVTNNAPLGGYNMTVVTPDGNTTTVPPQSSQTFNT